MFLVALGSVLGTRNISYDWNLIDFKSWIIILGKKWDLCFIGLIMRGCPCIVDEHWDYDEYQITMKYMDWKQENGAWFICRFDWLMYCHSGVMNSFLIAVIRNRIHVGIIRISV